MGVLGLEGCCKGVLPNHSQEKLLPFSEGTICLTSFFDKLKVRRLNNGAVLLQHLVACRLYLIRPGVSPPVSSRLSGNASIIGVLVVAGSLLSVFAAELQPDLYCSSSELHGHRAQLSTDPSLLDNRCQVQ